jgi:hypothetical protein
MPSTEIEILLSRPPKRSHSAIVWAMVGFLMACGWMAYAFLVAPAIERTLAVPERVVEVCAFLTCPMLLFGLHPYWILLINASTYCAVGLLVESMLRKLK